MCVLERLEEWMAVKLLLPLCLDFFLIVSKLKAGRLICVELIACIEAEITLLTSPSTKRLLIKWINKQPLMKALHLVYKSQ